MHLEAISNGLGGQSTYLLYLAGQGRIPATVSITGDTGSEEDCLWNTGERTTAKVYFDQVTKPLADKWGIDARFVRAVDKHKKPLLPLIENARSQALWAYWRPFIIPVLAEIGQTNLISYIPKALFGAQHMPLFNNKKNAKGTYGRLRQTCTSRWKLSAIKQEARRVGATHLRSAQGIHLGEAWYRIKGEYLRDEVFNGQALSVYQTGTKNKGGKFVPIKWMTHYYPLVDLKLNREQVRAELERLDIPYLVTTECDQCPHKDLTRWLNTSPATLDKVTELEEMYAGEYFFTNQRLPLKRAIENLKNAAVTRPGLFDDLVDFGCGNSYCGV